MLQDCPAGVSCGGSSGVLLTTTPSRPKRSPSESGSQVTWFAGQGLKGHSVAQRTSEDSYDAEDTNALFLWKC